MIRDYEKELQVLKNKDDAPKWMTIAGYKTLCGGYMLDGESPRDMFRRVSRASAIAGNFDDSIKHDFFEVLWLGYLGAASPVLMNMGTDRGLPISCFGLEVEDSMEDIMGRGIGELAMMTKSGGGVGIGFNKIRPAGSLIKNGKNGKAEGIIPFAKAYDSAILATKQGEVRRGNISVNLDIEHKDWNDFIKMRRPEGDINRQCLNSHHCTMISDEFMHKVKNGDYVAREKWTQLLKTRLETGESYIMFSDTVNNNNPQSYKRNGLGVNMTNICSEIVLHTDQDHSFVCCLSSMNLFQFDEIKKYRSSRTGMTVPEISVYFLNGVLDEFINKGSLVPHLEKAINSARKGRAIGLGVMGWHSLLQSKMIPFDSFKAMQLNNDVFKFIDTETLKASKDLAKKLEEPDWQKGTGEYNSHRVALAPTRSNSTICGGVSASIEPWQYNYYNDLTAKGGMVRKNPALIPILKGYGKDTDETWKSISENQGSVQHLTFMSQEERRVFKTAYEINQGVIVQQAGQRQKYIDQAQSINLFFAFDVDPKYFNEVHISAWELGVKTLYYCKSTSGLKYVNMDNEGCRSCEG